MAKNQRVTKNHTIYLSSIYKSFFDYRFSTETLCRKTFTASVTHKVLIFFCSTLVSHLSEVPKLSSYAKAEDKLFKYLFGSYQKWVRPVEQLNQTIRVKFGLAISQLVDVVRTGGVGLGLYENRLSRIEVLTLTSHPRMRRISEWQPTCGWSRQVELQWTTATLEISNNINLRLSSQLFLIRF